MDVVDEPQPSSLVRLDPNATSTISEEVSLFDESFDVVAGEENTYPFSVIGYTKLLISLTASSGHKPILIYNSAQELPDSLQALLVGLKWGATTNWTKTGTFSGQPSTAYQFMNWTGPTVFVFRDEDDEIIDPTSITGETVIAESLHQTMPDSGNPPTYNLTLESPNNLSYEEDLSLIHISEPTRPY